MSFFVKPIVTGLILFLAVSCQMKPTQLTETDLGLESRSLSKVEYQRKFSLKTAVIIDVRSRFQFDMSRLPRSFHVMAREWSLEGFSGKALQDKVKSLQRMLALKGVDRLTRVVILGPGLKGKGEEFLLASTLVTLGVEKISFMNETNARKAVVAQQAPPLENIPYWTNPVGYVFTCDLAKKEKKNPKSVSDIRIGTISDKETLSPSQVFTDKLEVREQRFPKSLNLQIYSEDSFWAYGLALYFKGQGGSPCVL